MTTINISFAVNGSVSQQIDILNGEEPQIFFEKLKRGDYLTTISGDVIYDLENDFKVVGTINDQSTLDAEFDSWELIEE